MKQHQWTDAEKRFVWDTATRLSDAQIAAALARLTGRPFSPVQVRELRNRMGVRKDHGAVTARPDDIPDSDKRPDRR